MSTNVQLKEQLVKIVRDYIIFCSMVVGLGAGFLLLALFANFIFQGILEAASEVADEIAHLGSIPIIGQYYAHIAYEMEKIINEARGYANTGVTIFLVIGLIFLLGGIFGTVHYYKKFRQLVERRSVVMELT